jgi:uncharacterized protein (TIGR03083 family)
LTELRRYRDSIAADAATIVAALRTNAEAAVVHCPGWSVADLVRHHGDVFRWAAAIVRTGEPDPEEYEGPADLDELEAWYDEGLAGLMDALDRVDPDRPCWTFGYPPAATWFWWRRQALEAAVHRWDAQVAIGTPSGFDPRLAADGVAEVATTFFPRQVDLDRTPPLSAPVVVRATDAAGHGLDGRWVLPGIADEPEGELAGPLAELLLLLWRRRDLDDGTVTITAPPTLRDEIVTARFAP